MKKLFKVALVAVCMLFAGNYAQAQKIGYIKFNDLIDLMPETKTIKTQLDAYQKQFVDSYTTMTTEFNQKAQVYEKGKATMTDAARGIAENELQDFQKRIQDFQTDARNKVEAKSGELTKPLFTKAKNAISQVAQEKGYAYVIDASQTELLVSPAGDDMMTAVKAKLAIK